MKTNYRINHPPMPSKNPRDIPNLPGTKITVIKHDGDLVNCTVLKPGVGGALQLSGVDLSDIRGWIPNNER